MSSSPDVNTLAALTHIGNIILFRAPTQDEATSRARVRRLWCSWQLHSPATAPYVPAPPLIA